MRIGLFSGTFDPIHIGHIEVCLVALGAVQLDEVLVLIEKNPHRKEKVTDYKHRQKMVELALADFKTINLFDSKQDNITFDNTMPQLTQTYKKAEFCMIIGSDMLAHISDWPGASEWLPKLELIVVLRDNKEKTKVQSQLEKLPTKSSSILPAVWSPVSSSSVKKELISEGHSNLIHREVKTYIAKHKLYGIKPASRKKE